jgi:hypothetical protein
MYSDIVQVRMRLLKRINLENNLKLGDSLFANSMSEGSIPSTKESREIHKN